MANMYTELDEARKSKIIESTTLGIEPYRHPFRRDISRLMHAPAFRRLQGKTQLFPCQESDFFRNRLTHSMEVAQLAESISYRLNHLLKEQKIASEISSDVCRFASLAHDLGHPPFGHLGEEVLNLKMHGYGGFEGNAQTLRILTRLEQTEIIAEDAPQVGLNLCYRSIASVLKYNSVLPDMQTDKTKKQLRKLTVLKPKKGYYLSEESLVRVVKENIAPEYNGVAFKTVECAIMDIADDISNAVYDLEDAFKGGFCSPLDIISAPHEIWDKAAKKVKSAIEEQDKYLGQSVDRTLITSEYIKEQVTKLIGDYLGLIAQNNYQQSRMMIAESSYLMSGLYAQDGGARTKLCSHLIGKFVRGVNIKFNSEYPAMSLVYVDDEQKILIDALKNLTYEFQITSKKLRIVAIRGTEIVSTIFDTIIHDDGYMLMPNSFVADYIKSNSESERMRIICDFVAGMTDRYAIEFYGRLKSENPETIFKPF